LKTKVEKESEEGTAFMEMKKTIFCKSCDQEIEITLSEETRNKIIKKFLEKVNKKYWMTELFRDESPYPLEKYITKRIKEFLEKYMVFKAKSTLAEFYHIKLHIPTEIGDKLRDIEDIKIEEQKKKELEGDE